MLSELPSGSCASFVAFGCMCFPLNGGFDGRIGKNLRFALFSSRYPFHSRCQSSEWADRLSSDGLCSTR